MKKSIKHLITVITAIFILVSQFFVPVRAEINTTGTSVYRRENSDWFSDGTAAIIENHRNDFNTNNFESKMREYGGYE
jgi:hypothetical protein